MTADQAAALIGDQPATDYALDLAAHAERYKDVPGLAPLLRSARLGAIRQQYEQADADATAAQTQYKTNVWRANAAILVAASLSALMMAAQILAPKLPIEGLVTTLGILSALSGAAATTWLFRVRQGNMLDAWMQRRAEAETQRLSYFIAVADPDGPPNNDLDLLRLEYFRRYQLDVQKNYYQYRGLAHRVAANKTLDLGSYAVLLSTGSSLLAAGLGAVNGLATALGVVGVFGAALSSYANSREALSQDRRNAERYARTRVALGGLEARLDQVRGAVAGGNRQALTEFVGAVNEQISLEHRQWLEATETTRTAVAKLDEALGKAQNTAPQPPVAPRPPPAAPSPVHPHE